MARPAALQGVLLAGDQERRARPVAKRRTILVGGVQVGVPAPFRYVDPWAAQLLAATCTLLAACSGLWDAAVKADEQISNVHEAAWDENWGDRMQELVFIGIRMDEARFRGAPSPSVWKAMVTGSCFLN